MNPAEKSTTTSTATENFVALQPRVPRVFAWVALLTFSFVLNACLEPGQGTFSSTNLLSSGTTGGAMAVQIAFNDNPNALTATNTSGTPASFVQPTSLSAGTFPSTGLTAQILYNADGSFLAGTTNGTHDTTWPTWITSVELGLTGSNATYKNPVAGAATYASNPNCARFALSGGDQHGTCTIGANAGVDCRAPAYQFRVSEADCVAQTTADPTLKSVGLGNGSTNDNVYVRVNLNRAGLAATENLMMVVNYQASSYAPADTAPADCITTYSPIPNAVTGFVTGFSNTSTPFTTVGGTNLTAENCTDFVWKTYMRHSKTESAVVPFSTLIPPTYASSTGNTNNTSGTTVSTRQIIFPIAGDQNIQVIQLSRTFSKLVGFPSSVTDFSAACDPGQKGSSTDTNSGANTPNCAGFVLYSITLFRI